MFITKFLNLKLKNVFGLLLLATCIFALLFLAVGNRDGYYKILTGSNSNPEREHPVILWWTEFTGENGVVKKCSASGGNAECLFTNDRTYVSKPNLKALLFYGSSFVPWDLPPHSDKRPLWALLHEESPRNSALLQHEEALQLFNFSATFSRLSNLPLTLQHLSSLEELIGNKFLLSWDEKTKFQSEQNLAPVVYIQSDCDTATDRDSYVRELMKHIPVDSYGACLQNKELPENIRDPMDSLHNDEFWRFQSRYKFSIAFENGECEDYITEKLWRPLIVGSVPIYFGAPNIRDWLPFNESAILASDFASPRELATYIKELDEDKFKYNQHLVHKNISAFGKINTALLNFLQSRTWSVGTKLWENFDAKTLVEEFECLVCRALHSNPSNRQWVVNRNHYNCPVPRSALTKKDLNGSFWTDQWYQGKFEAQILNKLVHSQQRISQDKFYEIVNELMVDDRRKARGLG